MKLGTPCVPEDTLSFTGRHNADFTLDIRAMTGRGEHLKATAYFAESAASNEKIHFCYKAGPAGYGLDRLITDPGHSCLVGGTRDNTSLL